MVFRGVGQKADERVGLNCSHQGWEGKVQLLRVGESYRHGSGTVAGAMNSLG